MNGALIAFLLIEVDFQLHTETNLYLYLIRQAANHNCPSDPKEP